MAMPPGQALGGNQLALDLGTRPALGHADFIVGPGNADAVAWLDRWPDWPGRVLALAGPPGCGKTHLAHVWQARSGARLVRADVLWAEDLALLTAGGAAVVIDDADRCTVPEALFHLINRIRDASGSLLLTGVEAPARWPATLPDLASRLKALPVAILGPPDDALLEALMVKLFADRQIRVGAGVIAFLASRIERSAAAISDVVEALDEVSLTEGRAISLGLARKTLDLIAVGRTGQS